MRQVLSVVAIWLVVWCSGSAVCGSADAARSRVSGQHLHAGTTSTRPRPRWTTTATSSWCGPVTMQDRSSHGVFAQRLRLIRPPPWTPSSRSTRAPACSSTGPPRHGQRRRLRRGLVELWRRRRRRRLRPALRLQPGRNSAREFQVNTYTLLTFRASRRWPWTTTATSSWSGSALPGRLRATASSLSASTRAGAAAGRRVPGQHLHAATTRATPRWRWTATAISSWPGRSLYADGSYLAVFAQRFDSPGDGSSVPLFQVNTYTISFQFRPSVAMNDVGLRHRRGRRYSRLVGV